MRQPPTMVGGYLAAPLITIASAAQERGGGEHVPDMQSWLIFLWCAGFATVAYVLDVAQKRARQVRVGTHPHRRTTDAPGFDMRAQRPALLLNAAVTAFWGGLGGWLAHIVFPVFAEGHFELLGVLSAVIGIGGTNLSRELVTRWLGLLLHVDFKPIEEEKRDDNR